MRVIREQTVIQITFMPRVFPVNCYLVEEEDGLTLIDAAMAFGWKGILQAASSLGKPIRRILLTHAHADHVGALDRLRAACPDAEVAISERDARLLAGDYALLPGEHPDKIRGGFNRKLRTRPDRLLRDGERIGSLTAIAAPGHTPGHMAFMDERCGILIAGDAFQTRGGVAVSGIVRPGFPFPAMATWSREAALATARKLRELRPSVLAVGHGEMIREPLPSIDQAILEAEQHSGTNRPR
jgi:glyoxylase-like metal-dependent hydrolase (beta-lactamase superfamily II)